MNALEQLQSLVKALEAGGYDAAPGTLVQGSALQTEDLSPVMNNVTFDDSHIKLQKMLKVSPAKSTLVQFDRQLSYGGFGGTAVIEGAVGQEFTDDYVRIVVPMCYYSHIRRVTLVANMVNTVDGKDASERAASSAAKKIAADVEFDLFRGKEAFSNAGAFDGNPGSITALPNILGLGEQIRQSDSQRNAKDLMFGEYGSDETVVIQGGGITSVTTVPGYGSHGTGVLTQSNIEDAAVRSAMNMGNADRLILDPKTLAAYNKLAFEKERIILAGSPQDASGADLRRQWVSGGTVQLEASRFLSGKTRPQASRPGVPTVGTMSAAATDNAQSPTGSLTTGTYIYLVTACNELGESAAVQATDGVLAAATDSMSVTISNQPTGALYYNIYRSDVGGTTTKWVGRVNRSSGATTVFIDRGAKLPGFVTGYLIQGDTMEVRELSPYSRLKLAVTDLSIPEAHFRFLTLTVPQPRKNVLVDNLKG
jgi:hypothetical protein